MMRLFALHKLRERTAFTATTSTQFLHGRSVTARLQHSIALQLDYYMSPQFAGIACALSSNLYDGMNLSFLPTCPVGLELERVRAAHDAAIDTNTDTIAIGVVEQNIFIPTLVANPSLQVKAVAAMFRKSPLCILGDKDPIGAHEDTVDLLQRIFPHRTVIASPRASKITDLTNGTLGSIQAYTTTELPTLRHTTLDPLISITPLEGLTTTSTTLLGYSQVLFTTSEVLEDNDKRATLMAFLQATFKGWDMAIRDPKHALNMVHEIKQQYFEHDEPYDHWHPSVSEEIMECCNNHVKETFQGNVHGVIHAKRWSEATNWLLSDHTTDVKAQAQDGESPFGLDTTVWQPSTQLLAGNELARTMLEETKQSAVAFHKKYHRLPTLAVISVGELPRYTHADRRLQLYSNAENSWFSKTTTGQANGFDVTEIHLEATVTTDDLLSQIYKLKTTMDGIQLMWPLPSHIDSAKVYNAIDASQDVDGIHYIGQCEIGNQHAFPPVTPAATMALLNDYGISVKGKKVLVVGRSPIVGSPLAHMLREEDAIVTVVHSHVTELESFVKGAEIVISCAGSPGIVDAEWTKGAIVINVGTTFSTDTDSLHSDVVGDLAAYASQYSPVPGGVGPLSVPILFQNVVKAAWARMEKGGDGWTTNPSFLHKTFHFNDYTTALKFANKVNDMSSIMDHHANLTFTHECVDGVNVRLEFFTFEANEITEKDYEAAKAVDLIAGEM